MIRILKPGRDASARAADAAKVRATVEEILADVAARGDAAVRDYSARFDNWSPESFRLGPEEIEAAIAAVPARDLDDIRFAQAQIRRFAEISAAYHLLLA